MTVHDEENWVALYHAALIELEHALMSGRIKDARTAIISRVEKLQDMPGLHSEERRAIADALASLRFLELEDSHFDAEKQRRVYESLERLRSVAAAVLKTRPDEKQK